MAKPNWRKADDYKFTEEISHANWAWEFLRRNHKYQIDFEVVKLRLADIRIGQKYPNLDATEWSKLSRHGALHDWISDIVDKWGMEAVLANPDDPYHFLAPSWKKIYGKFMAGRGTFESEIYTPDNPELQSIVFDLTMSIEAQISAAQKWLEAQRDERAKAGLIELIPEKRSLTKKWTQYLRVLDAENEGVKSGEMASVLMPETKNEYPDYAGTKAIENWLKAARKLRDFEYIALPLITS